MGIKYSTGDVIAFIDDDAIADEEWLSAIMAEYSNETVVGVGGSIIEKGREVLTKKNHEYNGINENGEIYHNVRIKNMKELPNLSKGLVTFFMGGNMSFRRKILLKVGGVDRHFSGNCYREESDLCLSVKKHGKLIFQPHALIFHFSSPRGGNQEIIKNESCKFIFWDMRNTSILFFKHLKFLNSIYKSVSRLKTFVMKTLKNKILVESRPNLEISSRLKSLLAILLGFVQGIAMGIGYKLNLIN